MRLKYKITEHDAKNIQLASSRPLWALLLLGLLLAVTFLIGLFLIHRDLPEVGWFWIAASVLFGIFAYGVPYFELRKALRTSPVLQGEIEYIFGEDCVQTILATGEIKVWWKTYTKYKETRFICAVSRCGTCLYPEENNGAGAD